jgi:DNA-binding NtrC family response regulator
MKQILVATINQEICLTVSHALADRYSISCVKNMQQVAHNVRKKRPDLIFIDLEMLLNGADRKESTERLTAFKNQCNEIEIVVLTKVEDIRSAISVVKAGAADYLTLPIDSSEVQLVLQDLEENLVVSSELDHLRDQFWGGKTGRQMHTRNPMMQQVFDKIRLVARTKSTVLLTGDTGTGKTVLAKMIHGHSNRKNQVFMNIHCGAIPDTLIESELFGHEKGAFTGADRRKLGKFEIARDGTIFLDEVGTLSPSAQIKLLQVLQEKTFSRVGGTDSLTTDARVIAATNEDLKSAVEAGRFRKDLYYRLNVFPLELPPLSARTDDIPLLVEHFLKHLNAESDKKINSADPRVIAALKNYAWPGNIRELENLIERAHILEQSSILTPESFPSELFDEDMIVAMVPVSSQIPIAAARNQAVEDFERQYLKELLTANKGRINRSAETADISSRQLNKLMHKHQLHKEDFYE